MIEVATDACAPREREQVDDANLVHAGSGNENLDISGRAILTNTARGSLNTCTIGGSSESCGSYFCIQEKAHRMLVGLKSR